MFGTDFLRILETRYDKTYSSFFNPVKQNDFIAEALSTAALDGYKALQKEESFADMSNMISTNKICLVNNNQIYTFQLDITGVTFAALDVTVVTRVPHNLAVGDNVTLSDIAGFVAATLNGTAHTVATINSPTSFTFPIAAIAGVYTAGTGKIVSHQLDGLDKLIADFNYLLSVKQRYHENLNCKIVSASNAQPIVMTLDKRNNVKTGDKITQSGIVGNTNANGTFYVKKINAFKYELYRDKDFTIPVSGNGVYGGIGKAKRDYYKQATAIFSSTELDSFEQPSVSSPKFERGNGLIKFQPFDVPCTEITIDYFTTPPVAIDVTNGTVDLEDTYSEEFLYVVIDRAVNLISQAIKDTELYQTSMAEIKSE